MPPSRSDQNSSMVNASGVRVLHVCARSPGTLNRGLISVPQGDCRRCSRGCSNGIAALSPCQKPADRGSRHPGAAKPIFWPGQKAGCLDAPTAPLFAPKQLWLALERTAKKSEPVADSGVFGALAGIVEWLR